MLLRLCRGGGSLFWLADAVRERSALSLAGDDWTVLVALLGTVYLCGLAASLLSEARTAKVEFAAAF